MPNEINPTPQTPTPNPKHMSSFWPLVIVIAVAFIAGVITMYMISDTERQEDINSISFIRMVKGKPKVTPTPTPSSATDEVVPTPTPTTAK